MLVADPVRSRREDQEDQSRQLRKAVDGLKWRRPRTILAPMYTPLPVNVPGPQTFGRLEHGWKEGEPWAAVPSQISRLITSNPDIRFDSSDQLVLRAPPAVWYLPPVVNVACGGGIVAIMQAENRGGAKWLVECCSAAVASRRAPAWRARRSGGSAKATVRWRRTTSALAPTRSGQRRTTARTPAVASSASRRARANVWPARRTSPSARSSPLARMPS
jgi:hypothetical protein